MTGKPERNLYGILSRTLCAWLVAAAVAALLGFAAPCRSEDASPAFSDTIRKLYELGDRSTGTKGFESAVKFVRKSLQDIGFEEIGSHAYDLPVLQHGRCVLTISGRGGEEPLHPFHSNAVTPGAIPEPGWTAPLIYVGQGSLSDFNGKAVQGAFILMEMESAKNWVNAASLGARGLIFVDRGPTPKMKFTEKEELTPIQFPLFWMSGDRARELFGDFETAAQGMAAERITLKSSSVWRRATGENLYCLVSGTDKDLSGQLIVVEAFIDSTALVPGMSRGADEACGLATLLDLARFLKKSPPKRSVLLVATSGHAQSLAGMREMIWAMHESSRLIRRDQKFLEDRAEELNGWLSAIENYEKGAEPEGDQGARLLTAISDRIKTEVDRLSQELMRLRLEQSGDSSPDRISKIQMLADQRLDLRRLGWRGNLKNPTDAEKNILTQILPLAKADHKRVLADVQRQTRLLRSARAFRQVAGEKDVAAIFSLHLSSRGNGVGAFNDGFLYKLAPEISRVGPYNRLTQVLGETASGVEKSLGLAGFYHDTLRPSRLRPWRSYFLDAPALGGEVSALAGYLGATVATVNDAREWWGTPYDEPGRMDLEYAEKQSAFVCNLIRRTADVPTLRSGQPPQDGFSSVTGRAKFIRQGELFPDQPAPGTTMLAFQGPGTFHAMVDELGVFHLRGMADKQHVPDKVILEGYRFDAETGQAVWAIDKEQTGKDAYRVRMQRKEMETDLVMFACRQSTVFNLLEPRSFRYLYVINLLDGRMESAPLRYWWSRIDTWSSVLASFYLESGTRYKLTLSDTVLDKKLILLNASPEKPEGVGYLVDEWPVMANTELMVARDMWTLLKPRVANLESHGIYDEKIRELQDEGARALDSAEKLLKDRTYDLAREEALTSWALATRVYRHVEQTQKDVLFGVLFYIALFVPFAFCMERFIFSYSDINKRIIAFLVILLALIAIIYNIHPAFQLAYSPTVVILAFFILGLSLVVTLIIFFRFEEEMILLQKRASHVVAAEISRWQAFAASFLLGVSNLKRRRLRTILTCITLIILTFTIMSFTSVKSLRYRSRVQFMAQTPYQGYLLKYVNWRDFPAEGLAVLKNAFGGKGAVGPRVWMEAEDRTYPRIVSVQAGGKEFLAQGVIGLSPDETKISNFPDLLIGGRWFQPGERRAILLPDRMARELGIDPQKPQGTVRIWGMPFEVVGVFSGKALGEKPDLDGESLTPVTFPGDLSMFGMTELESESLESGEDIRAFQGRYQHVSGDLTVILPDETVMSFGGKLKAIAVKPSAGTMDQAEGYKLVDRFRLSIFIGEDKGTYLYHASDTLSYSGVPNIVIPILISIFIVLNTMIGSVYERKREIGIYTSVGLAPSHVSFLFIAEAMALAVISVVMGYLVAQASAAIFSGTGLWSGITVNYSSLAGVAAMVLIFLVVLISVIYPSRVAAKIAIPDVNRAWTLPKNMGNELEIPLPVLFKYEESRSLGGFMLSYFRAFQDISHGLFSTGEIDVAFACPLLPEWARRKIAAEGDGITRGCLQFSSKVWLAPFDFGIMQKATMGFGPAPEDPGFLEVRVLIARETGEENMWRRVNKVFINQLRKQILVWRSLDDEAHRRFEKFIDEIEREHTDECGFDFGLHTPGYRIQEETASE